MPPELLASGMFALGCGLITAVLLRKTYKRIAKNKRPRNEPAFDLQPRPTDAWSGAHADASARVERQKVELHEQTREANATIDSKMILLRELIAQSDRQIERLEALLEETEVRA